MTETKYQVFYGSQALNIFTTETNQTGLLGELENTIGEELPNEFPYGIYDVEYTGYVKRGEVEVLTYRVTFEDEDGEEDFDNIELIPTKEF